MTASLFRRSNINSKWMLAAVFLASQVVSCGAWSNCARAQDSPIDASPAQEVNVNGADKQSLNTLIVVVGAGGSSEYTEQFNRWADDWAVLANQQGWQSIMIGKRSDLQNNQTDNANEAVENKPTDIEKLQKAIESVVPVEADTKSIEGKRLWLILIGHGTAAGKAAKFNLTGPDVTTTQLKSWLDQVKMETIVIDCTSSSAPFLVELSTKNRIVVSATRAGSEINFARFGGYMAAAVRDLTADLDHDHEVSLLEAFLKASKETDKFYRENARLTTEHALLEDNSDKTGTGANFYVGAIATSTAVSGKALDGKRAARVILWSSPQNVVLSSDQIAQRDSIEAEIDKLREQKKRLSEKDYYDQLEKLMLEMAEVYSE